MEFHQKRRLQVQKHNNLQHKEHQKGDTVLKLQDIVMILLALAFCAISFLLMYKDMKKHKEEFKLDKKLIVFTVISTVIVMVIAGTLQLKFVNNYFIFNLKRVILLAILWAVAYIDFDSYRIPNEFIIWGL